MNRRPGHVDVTTEVGYCNFCQRTRNLRTEAHHLGALVRTVVTCETCHRTLSSTMGVATAVEPEPAKAEEPVVEVAEPKPKRTAVTKAATKKKPIAKRTAAAKKAPPAKPRSTATRKVTKKK